MLYRDSAKGLCYDLNGPGGNGFEVMATGMSFDNQIREATGNYPCYQKFHDHLEFVREYAAMHKVPHEAYALMLLLFQYRYPFCTLENIPEEANAVISRYLA